jgi:AsmA protein
MNKAIAWTVGVVVGVPVVLAATAAILVNTLDQQALLNKASAVVKQKQQRDLAFTGPVSLKWFPSIGADLNGVTLSEFQSDEQFLKADKVSVSLALLPLLSSRVVVDAVQASGVQVNVIKDKAGRFNFDDLASQPANDAATAPESTSDEAASGQSLDFSVDSIALSNLNVNYTDMQSGLNMSLNDFSVESGRIEENLPVNVALKGNVKANKPQADLNVDVQTLLEFGLGENLYANFNNLKLAVLGQLDGQQADVNVQASTFNVNPNTMAIQANALEAAIKGQVPKLGALDLKLKAPALLLDETTAKGETLDLSLALKQADRTVNVALNLTGLQGNLKESVQAALSTTLNMTEGPRSVKMNLKSPLAVNVKSQLIELANLAGQLDVTDPALPKKSASMPLAGSLAVNNIDQTIALALKSSFEGSQFDLNANVADFTKPAIVARLNADTLDLDAMFPRAEKAAAGEKPSGPASSKDTPIDLSPLRGLNLDLTAKVGQFKFSDIQASQLNTRAVARGGKLTLSPVDAKLYGGSTSGVITADANSQSVTVNQTMTNVQIQPLMKALMDKDMAKGRGNVSINVRTQGNTVNEMKAALNGRVAVSLQDGAIKGINLAERFRTAKSFLSSGADVTQQANVEQETDFSAMSVSFDIQNGVATTNDLNVMAPLFRLGGQGKVNLIENSVDYLARASIVATSTGQGGKTLESGLNGVTVPVRLFGPFDAVQWKLMFKEVAQEALKAKLTPKLDETKQELKDKVQDKREELKGKAEDKLKDAFKGFLSR